MKSTVLVTVNFGNFFIQTVTVEVSKKYVNAVLKWNSTTPEAEAIKPINSRRTLESLEYEMEEAYDNLYEDVMNALGFNANINYIRYKKKNLIEF